MEFSITPSKACSNTSLKPCKYQCGTRQHARHGRSKICMPSVWPCCSLSLCSSYHNCNFTFIDIALCLLPRMASVFTHYYISCIQQGTWNTVVVNSYLVNEWTDEWINKRINGQQWTWVRWTMCRLGRCQSNYFPYFLPPALSCNGFLLIPKVILCSLWLGD